MPGEPLGFFSLLTKVCVRDDRESRRPGLLTVTALSFLLGVATSVFTAYVIALVNV